MSRLARYLRRATRLAGFELVRRTDRGAAALPAFLERFRIDTVLDVGANVGQYGSALRAAGYSGRIVSFEPDPEACRLLAERAARDPAWEAVAVGLGAEDGTAELNVSAFSVFSSMLKTTEYVEGLDGRSRAERTVRVPVTTVDAVWAERVRPGARVLLKIDTQGSERAVLAGASRALEQVVGVQIELSLRGLYAGQPAIDEMLRLLRERGFAAYAFVHGFADPRTEELLEADGIFFRRGTTPPR
jgi:FkbM family methyltransferase